MEMAQNRQVRQKCKRWRGGGTPLKLHFRDVCGGGWRGPHIRTRIAQNEVLRGRPMRATEERKRATSARVHKEGFEIPKRKGHEYPRGRYALLQRKGGCGLRGGHKLLACAPPSLKGGQRVTQKKR